MENNKFDFIIIGSGAGGGPLAANLAKAGFTVLLMEAGGTEQQLSYAVPSYQGVSTEDEHYRWDYFVRHYANDNQQLRDPKWVTGKQGILYPRAGTLGGCTAHNALIIVYPSDSDWNNIADITGDESWRSDKMRTYFERIEACNYLNWSQAEQTGHGTTGWLSTEKPDTSDHESMPKLPSDKQLARTLASSDSQKSPQMGSDPQLSNLLGSALLVGHKSGLGTIQPLSEGSKIAFDPNGIAVSEQRSEGFHTIPLSTKRHARNGSREYILQVAQAFPNNLTICTNAFVTKILLDDNNVATGVSYLKGSHLYAADPNAHQQCTLTQPVELQATANLEVIVCCGAFNTPQLLKLSGIGPKEELDKWGIPVKIDLPGVGANLQDRYEVGVVVETIQDFTTTMGATFSDDADYDPFLKQWQESRTGIYTSSGGLLALLKRSTPDLLDPNLYMFAFGSRFQGYFPRWFSTFAQQKNYFTWAILKAHTENTAGTVLLKSTNPLDTPDINFHYFEEGTGGNTDLKAVCEAVSFARQLLKPSQYIKQEVVPGNLVQTETEVEQFVRDQAWGHHCSCTAKIGSDDDAMAVLDSNFKVRGTKNLRVVDASVFPKIPGYFIVLPIYMISEKASDVIIACYTK